MTDFTPNTELVRNIYVEAAGGFGADLVTAEFTRWLVAHDAQVAADAWDEGHNAGWNSRDEDAQAGWTPSGIHESDAVNPYRTLTEAPELFPGTREALNNLTIRME